VRGCSRRTGLPFAQPLILALPTGPPPISLTIVFDRDTHRDFNETSIFYFADQAEDLCAGVLRCSQSGNSSPPTCMIMGIFARSPRY